MEDVEKYQQHSSTTCVFEVFPDVLVCLFYGCLDRVSGSVARRNLLNVCQQTFRIKFADPRFERRVLQYNTCRIVHATRALQHLQIYPTYRKTNILNRSSHPRCFAGSTSPQVHALLAGGSPHRPGGARLRRPAAPRAARGGPATVRAVALHMHECQTPLYLLENSFIFEGNLFINSNRVASFDPAALSRVTLAVKFAPLTNDGMRQVCQSDSTRARPRHFLSYAYSSTFPATAQMAKTFTK